MCSIKVFYVNDTTNIEEMFKRLETSFPNIEYMLPYKNIFVNDGAL